MFAKCSQFYKVKETEQLKDQVVDVSNWSIGSELVQYPEGARAKFEFESLEKIDYKFLIPSHKYLFKRSYSEQSGTILYEQFWNEIIAYKLGRILGIPVPPAFVASYKDSSGSYYGALIEWFYDYESQRDISKRGGDLMVKHIHNYERTKGTQHNFGTIKDIMEKNQVSDWLRYWTEMLLFDAIIANQDRHQDNWQIINYAGDSTSYLSPAFDNGSSMEYKVRSIHLKSKSSKFRLEAHIKKGMHHMKWSLHDEKKAGHIEILQKLMYTFPEAKEYLSNKLSIDISAISKDIKELVSFPIEQYSLSEVRAQFIIDMLLFRFNFIKKECGI
jgi:hypothetical protein